MFDEKKMQVESAEVTETPKANEKKKSTFLTFTNDQWKMVAKQVNFYYSDKNYYKDDFLL